MHPVPPPHRTHCADCKESVFLLREDAYMVTDRVWATSGGGKGVLCIGCLEERIGRRLVPEDFPEDVPLNGVFFWDKTFKRSARLLDRMGRRGS